MNTSFTDDEADAVIDAFEEVVQSEYFHENVKISYRMKIALECLAFNDSLYEILINAFNLYEERDEPATLLHINTKEI
jgi:hypothetical protein